MAIKPVIFQDNDQLREMLFQMINISEGLSCTGAYSNAMDIDLKCAAHKIKKVNYFNKRVSGKHSIAIINQQIRT